MDNSVGLNHSNGRVLCVRAVVGCKAVVDHIASPNVPGIGKDGLRVCGADEPFLSGPIRWNPKRQYCNISVIDVSRGGVD